MLVNFEKTALYMANLDRDKALLSRKNRLILFNCSKAIKKNVSSKVRIVSPKSTNLKDIRLTLNHFGVPDDCIKVETYLPKVKGPQGIWVLVA